MAEPVFDEEEDSNQNHDHLLPEIIRTEQHFVCALFGYQQAISLNFCANFDEILRNFNILESYCDNPQDLSTSYDYYSVDLSIEEALQCPSRIAQRTSILMNSQNQLSSGGLKGMWCRLVSHYLEWLAGIPELRFLIDIDKLRLITKNLCRVICLSCAWRTYESGMENGMVFGGGYCFLPERFIDPTVQNYARNLASVIQLIVRQMKQINFTKEEYLLLKLTVLFSESQEISLSEAGREIVVKALTKYTQALVDLCRNTIDDTDEDIIYRRMRDMISILPHLGMASEVDDRHLTEMTINNAGQLQGRLTNEFHVHAQV